MSNYADEGYKSMLGNFRTNDLQNLLAAFGHNKSGRKSELKERAIGLLRNRTTGFNQQAYLAKILDIYRSMQNDVVVPPNNDMIRNMMQNRYMQQAQQQRMYQPPQYPQQPMHMTRAGLPQVMPQMQRGMYGNNISGNSNNIQYGYQQSGPRNIVPPNIIPTNQQHLTSASTSVSSSEAMGFDMNAATSSGNSFVPSPQTLTNIRLRKLPFYEINSEIIKPTNLVGQERCSLTNVPRGMREGMYKVTLLPSQATIISMNRDLAKNEFIYQVQIRICQLEATSTEITDYLPLGLHIRVNSKVCPLPPTAPNTRPGTEARRIPRPINCTQLIKLNPNLINQITVNWTPDSKNYVMAVYVVKKISSDTLLQKLRDKGSRSSEDTKNDIIKKLADVDPDLATTSYRFSLVCPLGKMKMKIPAKSICCDHLQCFDASIFILMNEKKPTWMCPTCNKPCLYDDIQIQSYFLDIVTNSTLADSCKEIEILADGTWKVFVESKEAENMETTPNTKEKPMDSVNLDDSDDGGNDDEHLDAKKESKPESSKDSESLKCSFVDLTLSDGDEEEPPKEKDKQENEAQAADAVQSVTTVDFKPQAQVQPQQAVTSSEQGVVIEIDSPSPPTSPPPPTTSAS